MRNKYLTSKLRADVSFPKNRADFFNKISEEKTQQHTDFHTQTAD